MEILSASAGISSLPVWTIIPFILMLATIAVGPLWFEHWWEQNKNKLIVSLILGIPTAIYLIAINMSGALGHELLFDYVPFIILLGSLFVITGGIYLQFESPSLRKTKSPGVSRA